MKHINLILVAIVIGIFSQSCYKRGTWGIKGKGENVSESRDHSGFNKIKLSIDAEVNYTQDSVYKIEISAQSNILAILKTEVNGTELRFDFKRNVWDHHKIVITIHSPDMRALSISGSGGINLQNHIITNDLELDVSGSGSISIPTLTVQNLSAKISGSGNVKVLGGTIKNESFNISGSGDIDALNAVAENGICRISGSGDMFLYVTENLDVAISGSGRVKYKGKPSVTSEISGSGRLTHIN